MKKTKLLMWLASLFAIVFSWVVFPTTTVTVKASVYPLHDDHIEVFRGYEYVTYAITDDHRLLGWGRNTYNQLLVPSTGIVNPPVELNSHFNLAEGEHIVDIAVLDATVAVTNQNRVFIWGRNNQYFTGITSGGNMASPLELTSSFTSTFLAGEKIDRVFLSSSVMTLFTSHQRIIKLGSDGYGIGGMGYVPHDGVGVTSNQIPLDVDETIVDHQLNTYAAFALTSKGRLYSWGSNANQTLGYTTAVGISSPTLITFPTIGAEKIASFKVSSTHAIAISDANRLFVWGQNGYGQLMLGTTTDQVTPVHNNQSIVATYYLGTNYTLKTLGGTSFTAWGRNQSYQLGLGFASGTATVSSVNGQEVQFQTTIKRSIVDVLTMNNVVLYLDSEGHLWGTGSQSNDLQLFGGGSISYQASIMFDQYTQLTFVPQNGDENIIINGYQYETFTIPTVTKEGFTFRGWYLSPTPDNVQVPLSSNYFNGVDATYYAVWDAPKYNLTYLFSNGTTFATYQYEEGATISNSHKLNVPYRDYYTIVGWDQSIPATMPAQNVTLTPVYEPVELTLKVNLNRSNNDILDVPTDYDSLLSLTLDTLTFSHPGYSFDGWYSDMSLQTPLASDARMTAPNQVMVYAKWRVADHVISFNMAGGEAIASIAANEGDELNDLIGTLTPAKVGHSFDGWYIDSTYTTVFTLTTMPDDNLSLYAKWRVNSYSLVLLDHDGSVIDTLSLPYGTDLSSYTITITPQRLGYNFSGWQGLAGTMGDQNVTITATYSVTPSPEIEGITPNQVFSAGQVVIVEWDVGTATLNGQAITNGAQVSTAGDYTLVVTHNGVSTTIEFTILAAEEENEVPPFPWWIVVAGLLVGLGGIGFWQRSKIRILLKLKP